MEVYNFFQVSSKYWAIIFNYINAQIDYIKKYVQNLWKLNFFRITY